MSGVEMAYVGMNQFLVSGRLEPGVKLGVEMTRQGLVAGIRFDPAGRSTAASPALEDDALPEEELAIQPSRNLLMVIAMNPGIPVSARRNC